MKHNYHMHHTRLLLPTSHRSSKTENGKLVINTSPCAQVYIGETFPFFINSTGKKGKMERHEIFQSPVFLLCYQ